MLNTHRLQSHTAPGWGWQRKCVFVTEDGWYDVEMWTVCGASRWASLPAPGSAPGHRVTDASSVWAASTEQDRLSSGWVASPAPCDYLFSSSAPEESVILSVKEDKPTHQVFTKCNLNMNIDIRICFEMFPLLLVKCLTTLQPAWSNWHWLAVYCSVQHAHIGTHTHYVPLVSGYRSAKYWPNISQSAKVRTCIAAAAQLLRHQTLSTTVIM